MLAFHLKGLLGAVIAGAIAGIVSRIASGKVQVGWVVVVVLVCFAIVLIVGFIRRVQTTYTVTSERLTIQTGILKRDLHETRLERVQNVNMTQSLLERMLRVGTVDFDTAAGAEYDFSFHGVATPHQIVRTVDQVLRELTPGPGV